MNIEAMDVFAIVIMWAVFSAMIWAGEDMLRKADRVHSMVENIKSRFRDVE